VIGVMAALSLVLVLPGCRPPLVATQVQVQNLGPGPTQVTLRSADGSRVLDLGKIEPWRYSEEATIDWPDVEDVVIVAAETHGGGAIDLARGHRNTVTLRAAPAAPEVVAVKQGLIPFL
jgi:hypothetical protein